MAMPRISFDPRRPHHWLAFGFGAGLVPWAPGTAGTLVGVPFYLLLAPLPLVGYLAVLAGLTLIGVWACDRTAAELDEGDPSAVVWDEILGLLVTLTAAPTGWGWILAGVVLFRIFDILKPWPIRVLDRRLKGGWGIVLDDLLAGLCALGVLQGLAAWLG